MALWLAGLLLAASPLRVDYEVRAWRLVCCHSPLQTFLPFLPSLCTPPYTRAFLHDDSSCFYPQMPTEDHLLATLDGNCTTGECFLAKLVILDAPRSSLRRGRLQTVPFRLSRPVIAARTLVLLAFLRPSLPLCYITNADTMPSVSADIHQFQLFSLRINFPLPSYHSIT